MVEDRIDLFSKKISLSYEDDFCVAMTRFGFWLLSPQQCVIFLMSSNSGIFNISDVYISKRIYFIFRGFHFFFLYFVFVSILVFRESFNPHRLAKRNKNNDFFPLKASHERFLKAPVSF